MARFEVDILGCGSATPSLRHLPACQVVDVRDTLYMIDCGEGAQLSARRMRLKMSRLRHIFISHLHGDHCLGLPGLLSTLALQQAGGEVTVHTFKEGVAMFKRIMDFFCRERTYDLKFNVIEPATGIIVDNDAITVETFPLYHRIPTVGFKFTEKPKPRHLKGDMVEFYQVPISQRAAIKAGANFVTADGEVIANERLTTAADPSVSYAYCSDTLYDERVAASVGPVDLLYHEATYADDNIDKAHQRGHSTASEAGRIATLAGARSLMIGHYSKSYNDEERHLAEARSSFSGPVIAATEQLRHPLL